MRFALIFCENIDTKHNTVLTYLDTNNVKKTGMKFEKSLLFGIKKCKRD